ncbi:MAG TPA: hypothetical protein VMR43_09770 [Variovorax sp.]|nr:hypothetical protein [Variovorax sp.]
MNQWETDFTKAVAALEIAYDTDVRAYATLKDDTKSDWGLQPLPLWPEAVRNSPMARARAALVAAENAVRDLAARRSMALRQARERRASRHECGAFAPTMPMVLEPANAIPAGLFSFERILFQGANSH